MTVLFLIIAEVMRVSKKASRSYRDQDVMKECCLVSGTGFNWTMNQELLGIMPMVCFDMQCKKSCSQKSPCRVMIARSMKMDTMIWGSEGGVRGEQMEKKVRETGRFVESDEDEVVDVWVSTKKFSLV